MKIIEVRLTGTRPLLMHADILADSLNPLTKTMKEYTSKRKKTDEDHEFIAKADWRAGMYFDEDLGPVIPAVNIEACIIRGGMLSKLGPTLKRSIDVVDMYCKLEYEGPRTIDGLWNEGFYDARSVKISTKRVPRYRPIFKKWSLKCQIAYDPDSIDRETVIKSLTDAGLYCGLGDYRPKFGRFSVEVLS